MTSRRRVLRVTDWDGHAKLPASRRRARNLNAPPRTRMRRTVTFELILVLPATRPSSYLAAESHMVGFCEKEHDAEAFRGRASRLRRASGSLRWLGIRAGAAADTRKRLRQQQWAAPSRSFAGPG